MLAHVVEERLHALAQEFDDTDLVAGAETLLHRGSEAGQHRIVVVRDRHGVPLVDAGQRAPGQIEVVDEGRVVTAHDGGFSDEFAPLEVHIYRART